MSKIHAVSLCSPWLERAQRAGGEPSKYQIENEIDILASFFQDGRVRIDPAIGKPVHIMRCQVAVGLVPLLTLLLVAAIPARAEEAAVPPAVAMATVTVTGQPEVELTGSATLNREQLEQLPARSGSLNEALGILPGVQLPEQGRSSTTGGEIVPPNLSISGGKSYQNNFLIDGIGNNSLLDPGFDDPTSLVLVPGHPQALFLELNLVEQVTVHRYNVPAAYGSFTGGVVEAQTRSPGREFAGEVVYRTTRHEWTQFHLDPLVKEEFENSRTQKFQPQFEKHAVGVLLDIPLSEKVGLLTSYQLNSSRITLTHMLDDEVQSRSNENFFAKLAYQPSSRTRLTASLQHAPYEGDYLYANALGSEFTVSGGGSQAILDVEHAADWGDIKLTGAWKASENRRDAAPDLYLWAVTPSKPWGEQVGTFSGKNPASFEGSLGSLEATQQGFELKGDVRSRILTTGPLAHRLNFGVDFEQVTGQLERDEPTNFYFNPLVVAADFDCPPGSDACIDGEQYLRSRQYYASGRTRATVNLLDGYLEDHLTWGRLELRPGLRVSYDDFMANTNWAPRLAASLDLTGDRGTVLIGGLNRYYGRTLLTYKLREASIPAQNFSRNATTLAWNPLTTGRPFRYSELDTPYADEAVLGIDQALFGGRLRLIGLKREGRDEFAQETVVDTLPDGSLLRSYLLTNRGESHHREVSAEWERNWGRQALGINITWQETETNTESYNSSIELTDLERSYWYDGELVDLDELPRRNFNRSWTGNLVYAARLPLGLNFTNVTRYRSGYEALMLLSREEKAALGLPPTTVAYQREKFPESWVFDWRFDWDAWRDQSLVFTLEINNVFDRKVRLGDPTGQLTYQNYELGRQVWLGLTWRF